MAKNTNKRIPIKWIRDRAKSAYQKKDHCYVCGTHTDLELHHTHSLTLLLEKWIAKTNRDFSSDEAVLENRDEFIDNHHKEIYEDVYTLCNRHHVFLHSVFGKAPGLNTAAKQSVWLQKQKAKLEHNESPVEKSGDFSVVTNTWVQFYKDIDTSFKQFIGINHAVEKLV